MSVFNCSIKVASLAKNFTLDGITPDAVTHIRLVIAVKLDDEVGMIREAVCAAETKV